MERNTFMSKKVIFLHPHSVIEQSLVRELVTAEYAIYLVSDHKGFRKIVGDFDEPIVFINIDENMSSEEWKEYISEMISSSDNTAQIGVLTYNDDKELAQTYLMDIGIPCGFIKLKLGLEQSRKIILKTLEANEAKGRRKYLRLDCWHLKNILLNFKTNEVISSGRIRDISSVGMAFILDKELELPKHAVLKDIQLKLRGKICRVSGPVIGSRKTDDGIIHVILFDKQTDEATRARIHSFMYDILQENINRMMLG